GTEACASCDVSDTTGHSGQIHYGMGFQSCRSHTLRINIWLTQSFIPFDAYLHPEGIIGMGSFAPCLHRGMAC
ncbi:MAG: hypothetical protein J6R75_04840, partial [Candidatus Methanomethylophilaceae archaeon]|nr:hypothetical protein [Candidatus Methanomethylophilaceae archaeon]